MKKHDQLGMNPGTASNRLVKDLLFSFVSAAGHKCHRCGEPMTRDNFSIDHKEAWLDSIDPVRLFFDLENIAYSHRACNSGAGRKPEKIYKTPEDRIEAQRRWQRESNARHGRAARRRAQYERTGN